MINADRLETLAELDTLVGSLSAWRKRLTDWPPHRYSAATVDRLLARIDKLRVRVESPLVVALLGGSGSGKSTLVNALAGRVVSPPGRLRPTTRKPVLVTRPDLKPELLGIPAEFVTHVTSTAPTLGELVLLDCPDPDTAEDPESPESNTARLRSLLPHCDVLLVTATQQRYRDARVLDELSAAAPGARLVFVQTHADAEDDIRADWREQLSREYEAGEMFLVDSLTALADAEAGRPPRGDFARLVEHLQQELSGTAVHRIRRANVLDLIGETLDGCRQRIVAAQPGLDQVEQAILEQRARMAARFTARMHDELQTTRRLWESRLLGEVASHWGLSPFSAVLRVSQGLGNLVSGAALWRVHTPAQLALWGAMEGARRVRHLQQQQRADDTAGRAIAESWDDSELRTAAIIVAGYARDAGLDASDEIESDLSDEATAAGQQFVERAAGELQQVVERIARRQSGRLVRLGYESCLLAVLAALVYRLAKNFFFDSWLAVDLGFITHPAPLLGVDFFIAAGFVLLLWCGLLLTLFTRRLRRGLKYELQQLAAGWNQPASANALFAKLEQQLRQTRHGAAELQQLLEQTQNTQLRLARTESRLGYRMSTPR